MTGRDEAHARRRPLVLTSAMAATLGALSGCGTPAGDDGWDANYPAASDTEVCVDGQGYRIEDWQCENDSARRYGGGWYYIRSGSHLPYYGDSVLDRRLTINGSRQPAAGTYYSRAPDGMNMTRSAAISRGGFGSRGRSFGSGRS